MNRHICGKVEVRGNCEIMQNLQGLAEFALIVAIMALRVPGGTILRQLLSLNSF